MAASHLGKTHSSDTLAKIGKAVGGRNHPMFGKPRAIGAGKPSQSLLVIDLEKKTETTYISHLYLPLISLLVKQPLL